MNKTKPELLTVKEAAELSKVCEATIYALCAGGELPHVRIGMGRGAIRIDYTDLIGYLHRKTVKKGPGPGPLKHIKL